MSKPTAKPAQPIPMFKVGEAAKRLGVSDQHVHDLIDEGRIQAINIGGAKRHYWRIPEEAIADFLKRHDSLKTG